MSLRSINLDDLEMILVWRNDDRIRMQMYRSHIISMAEHQEWFASMSEDSTRETLIYEREAEPIGVVTFNDIDVRHQSAFWGFYTKPGAPKGCGVHLGIDAMDRAFGQMDLRKINGEVLGVNQASKKFHEKLGFVKEGLFESHFCLKDNYIDIVRYAIFRDKWFETRESLIKKYVDTD